MYPHKHHRFIYQAEDKSNGNLNLALMGRFRHALNTCDLRELKFQNRKYTWSNERDTTTMARLDNCNVNWNITFDKHVLHALSSSLSDHCPLLISNQSGLRKPGSFRFETFWTKMSRFTDVVADAWNEPTTHTQPVHILNHKLKKTAKKLLTWNIGLLSNHKLQLFMALDVILQLDLAQENRTLSP